jgi:hypothetical protein
VQGSSLGRTIDVAMLFLVNGSDDVADSLVTAVDRVSFDERLNVGYRRFLQIDERLNPIVSVGASEREEVLTDSRREVACVPDVSASSTTTSRPSSRSARAVESPV